MTASHDDRIPLRFGTADQAGPEDALLLDETLADRAPAGAGVVARFRPASRHSLSCACCTGRDAAATALGRLFQDRATGRVAWFTRVLAVVSDPQGLADALRSDRLAAARFRLHR